MRSKRPLKKTSSTKASKVKKKPVATKKAKPVAVKKPNVIKSKVTPKKQKLIKKGSKTMPKKLTKPVKSATKAKPKKIATVKTITKAKAPAATKAAAKKPVAKAVKPTEKKAKSIKVTTLVAVATPKPAPVKTKIKPVKPKEKIITPPEVLVDENYMNEEHQDHFRAILLDWKKQLLEEMERTVHHMQDDAGSFADPNDRATQEEEFSLELRARDRERKLIKKIEEALQRIDHNDYGYCEACGVEIGAQRLEARPTATLCIDCKTIDEIREKHYG